MSTAASAFVLLAGALGAYANTWWRKRWWERRIAESNRLLDEHRYAEALAPLDGQPPLWSAFAALASGIAIGVGVAGIL